MIRVDDLRVVRGGAVVCDGVGLLAGPREVVGIVGPNGSGKSSLLLALTRSISADRGSVQLDGIDVRRLSRRGIARRVAVVAQEPETALPLSIRDTVALGRFASAGLLRYDDDTSQGIVADALAHVGLLDKADRLVTEISGGERQRVLIARAIAQQASHLLLDEPTNHLDLHHQFRVLDLVADLSCTVVVVLHDLNLAARYCDRVLVLDHGRIAAAGTPAETLRPELLEPIYRLAITRVERRGTIHLLYDSWKEHDTP